jgi:hypothetical protein
MIDLLNIDVFLKLVSLNLGTIDFLVDVLDVSEQSLHVHELRLTRLQEVRVEGLNLAKLLILLQKFLTKYICEIIILSFI